MNMNSPIRDDDEQEKPLDPAVEEVRRKIVKFVGINLAFLVFALMALGAVVVYKWNSRSAPVAAATTSGLTLPVEGQTIQGAIGLPAGARIVSQSLSGDRVSLQVEEVGGVNAIYIYDLAAGRMVARFAVEERK